MKNYLTTLILIFLSQGGFAEAEAEAEVLRKVFPWIYSGENAFQYESVSLDTIHNYCIEHEGEMAIWYEEYKKRFGEFADRNPRDGQLRPENGLLSGVRELVQIQVAYYINKRFTEGWSPVGMSGDFFIFEKRIAVTNQAALEPAGQMVGALPVRVAGSEIIIDVLPDEGIKVEGAVVTEEELLNKLKMIADELGDPPVKIRSDRKASFGTIIDVVHLCQKAGISNISFAAQASEKEE